MLQSILIYYFFSIFIGTLLFASMMYPFFIFTSH
nr:MAG TPA: hypothetical protein [Caudoviricetes sp.]